MTYASKFASRNSNAANDWAAQRQEKINRAKQLREERKRGAVDADCTFAPQKFNNYEPKVGSSRLEGGVSEYSQEYLRNFHFQAREEEQPPPVELNRKGSASSIQGSDSFGIHHIKPVQQRTQRPSAVNSAGQMIASNQFRHQPNHPYQQQRYAPGGFAPHDQAPPPQQYSRIENGDRQFYPDHPRMYEAGPSNSRHQQQYNPQVYSQPQQPEYNSPRYHQPPQQPQYYSDPYSIPTQQQRHSQPMNNNNQNRDERGGGYDALSSEMMRHGRASLPPEEDMCDMSYEFAASRNTRTPQHHQYHQQQQFSHPLHHQQQEEYANHYVNNEQEQVDLGGSSRLVLLRGKKGNPTASRTQHSYSAGSRRPSVPDGSTGEQYDDGQDQSRSVSARPRLDNRRSNAGAAAESCTRQSGCRCSQCGVHASFQSNSTSSGASRFDESPDQVRLPRRATKPQSRRKSASRPPWNGNFADEDATQDEGPPQMDDNYSHEYDDYASGKTRSTGPRDNRSDWNSSFADEQQQPTYERTVPSQVDHNDGSEKLDRMREELRGGRSDFIDQAHGMTKPGRRETFGTQQQQQRQYPRNGQDDGMTRNPPSAGRRAPPSNRQVNVQYRGMYMPEQQEEEQQGYGMARNRRDMRDMQQQRYQEMEERPAGTIEELPVGEASGMTEEIPEFAPVGHLHECPSCGRKFNEKSFEKHAKLCKKVFQTKRKTFDATKARLKDALQNPEDAQVVKSSLHNKSKRPEAKKSKAGKWKKQSQALREAMKYNKMLSKAQAEGKNLASLPPPPEDTNNDFVPCPHCGRTFNETAAERHIPRCKDQKAKPTRLMRGSGRNAVTKRK